jgi:hypothetical protein
MYYLAQTYTVGQAKGLKGVLWYDIWGWRNSGLLYPDYTYRPAGYAFAAAYSALHDAVFLEKITQFPRVEGYKFDKGGGRILWVLWSKDTGISYPVTLDRTPSAVFDALGDSLPLTTSIEVSQKPVYVEWLP